MYTRKCDRFNLLKKRLDNMDKAKVSIIFMRHMLSNLLLLKLH